jgi:3-dehydroquinate synthetase
VLSQVDSSVGGKTGVNLAEGKNLVGSFLQPSLVLADVDTLKSLEAREWNEGFAEIIKHAAIRDAEMIPLIDAVLDDAQRLGMADLIARNVAIKAGIVEADEFETRGLRALLNFGHTLGHAIEAAAGYGELLHGEAISLGLRAAAALSVRHAGLDAAAAGEIERLLRRVALPLVLGGEAAFETEALIQMARSDKKFKEGRIRFVLLRSLGDAFVCEDLTEADLRWALEGLRA